MLRLSPPVRNHTLEGSKLIFLFAVACFFRFYRLDELPGELRDYWATLFVNVALTHQGIAHFLEGEPLWFYYLLFPLWNSLTRLAFFLFGIGKMALFFFPMLTSALGAPISYLCFREMFSKEVGFFSALFLAVSYWDVSAIRYGSCGVNAFDGPLMTAFLWFVYRAAKGLPFSYPVSGILFALMLFNGNWHIAGCGLLIAAAFLLVQGGRISIRGFLSAAGWSLGGYLLLILLASYFLRVPHPAAFPVKAFRYYALKRAGVEHRSHPSAAQNLKKIVIDVFGNGTRDAYRTGWPLEGRPWLSQMLLGTLVVSLMGPLSFARASPKTKLLLFWMLIPPGIFALFFTVYAHHSVMLIPAVLAACALGLLEMMGWVRKILKGTAGRILSWVLGGVLILGLVSESHLALFHEFPRLAEQAYPMGALEKYLRARGVDQETLIVSNLSPQEEWELRIHSRFSLPVAFLNLSEVVHWPIFWEGMAFEKGFRRILYIQPGSVWRLYRNFRQNFHPKPFSALDIVLPEEEFQRLFSKYFPYQKESLWMASHFPAGRVHTLYFRNGDPAFFVVPVAPKQAHHGKLSVKERKAIASALSHIRESR